MCKDVNYKNRIYVFILYANMRVNEIYEKPCHRIPLLSDLFFISSAL